MKRNKGFTLIELLVVIAIIGILSAIVLASLSTARSKANDAKIQSQIASLRAAAEIYYSSNSGYGPGSTNTSCQSGVGMGSDPASGFQTLMTGTSYPGSTAPTCLTDSPASGLATKWAAYHILSNNTTYACADSSGKSEVTAVGATLPTVATPVCP